MTSQEEIKRQSSTGVKSTDVDPLCLNIDVYLQDVNPVFVHFLTCACYKSANTQALEVSMIQVGM